MELTPEQQKALTELVNIGFSRAADSLSRLLNQHITILTPQVQICTLEELHKTLPGEIESEVTAINQAFKGPLSGTAMLMLDYDSAAALLNLLTGEEDQPRRLTASDREALLEVGNILLNAYMGAFSNLLKVHVNMTVPHLAVGTVESILNTLRHDDQSLGYAITVRTEFHLPSGEVGGYVLLVMGIESLDGLIKGLDQIHKVLS